MTERPILFSAPMVRALLDGSKTQTRRAVKFNIAGRVGKLSNQWHIESPGVVNLCPYGQPGDHLWVRERFKDVCSGQIKAGYGELRYGVAYSADNVVVWRPHPTIIHDLRQMPNTGPLQFQQLPWRPSIHMSRRASRITLEVTDVRVQRLQDISEEDAVAEGAEPFRLPVHPGNESIRHKLGYAALWDQINGAGAWDANPWVWAISFRRVKP